uniref:Uncharacterized protein n=1 Tax=viral metagenome TaxID=1070528 RepID=A0A6M3LJ06_9ZZZZ
MPDLQTDFALVDRCLRRERRMREYVFARQPERLAGKVKEIDDALDALMRLRQAISRPQRDLFGRE